MDNIITAIVLLWTHSTYGVQVRLVGSSSPLEGRVEVYYNNRWGTICDDFFSTNDAGVICSMLGFERDGAKFFMKAYFGEGTGQIWLDDMKCEGSESSVENCIGSSWGIHNCHHSEDVGVRCRPKLKVRLVGGSHYYEGRIEVFFSGTWGTVCDDSFDDLDAQVFCHMLGYKRDNAVSKTSAFFGPGTGKIWLDDLQCTGTETSVGDCRMNGEFGCHNCGHSEDAGVVCRPGKCQALPSVTNGRFSPDSCTSSFNSAGLACTLFCNTGYEATSRNTTTCFDTGDWSHQISCADVDECALGMTKCTQQCVNTDGSYECRCNDGYTMMPDKRTCKDIDECAHGTNECTQQCVNTNGSYECRCNDGYIMMPDKKTCKDIDECALGTNKCTQQCVNTNGSYECRCNDGYIMMPDKRTCKDIDECAHGTNECTQQCVNTNGSYECRCNDGYIMMPDKKTCKDIDECALGTNKCTQQCVNTNGSYECRCNDGYTMMPDKRTCKDIDECGLGTNKCTQQCVNTNGSYECRCNDGYIMMPDKRTCKGVTYRIHLQIKQGADELPDNVVLDGNVTRGVRLALVSPKKRYEVMVYNVTGVNVGEIEDISLLKNADVNFVSVHNPYTNGYYIQRFESSNQVTKGKLCKRQFGEELYGKVDYKKYKGEVQPFKDINDIIDCKLTCIENPTFTCHAVHFHNVYGCNVLETIDNRVFKEKKTKDSFVSMLTGTTYQDIDSC